MKMDFDLITEKGERKVRIMNNGKEIGHIFIKDSYSGESSIQICGFKQIEGPWPCHIFDDTNDCCLVFEEKCDHHWKPAGVTENRAVVIRCDSCQVFKVEK